MRFDLTDDQETIRRTVAELLAERVTGERLRAHLDAGATDASLWDELRELGFAGLAVPEEHGGQGLGLLELGLVVEETGAALAPVPLLANAAAGLLVDAAGGPEDRAALLPAIADGGAPGAFAVLRDGMDRLSIDPDGRDGVLVVVEDGIAVLDNGQTPMSPAPTIDLLRRYRRVGADPGPAVSMGAARLPGDAAPAVDAIQLLLAAELTGVAQRALDLAVAYAKEREQFGRRIGSFQGVSHRCAAMLVAVETARSTWRYGCWVAGHDRTALPLAASTAKVAAIAAAHEATAGALQVLGGIGFTWEHDIHLLLRRARVGGLVLGGAAEHRARVARLLAQGGDDGAPGADGPGVPEPVAALPGAAR